MRRVLSQRRISHQKPRILTHVHNVLLVSGCGGKACEPAELCPPCEGAAGAGKYQKLHIAVLQLLEAPAEMTLRSTAALCPRRSSGQYAAVTQP